ncbi:hypothetical protein GGS21DRAFT_543949 [Xylaria nigripes]|nr:hypothetical protein GGS21DRAFT_543949 [Xylaria nigripes]
MADEDSTQPRPWKSLMSLSRASHRIRREEKFNDFRKSIEETMKDYTTNMNRLYGIESEDDNKPDPRGQQEIQGEESESLFVSSNAGTPRRGHGHSHGQDAAQDNDSDLSAADDDDVDMPDEDTNVPDDDIDMPDDDVDMPDVDNTMATEGGQNGASVPGNQRAGAPSAGPGAGNHSHHVANTSGAQAGNNQGEKPFACPKGCGFRTAKPGGIREHVKNIHIGTECFFHTNGTQRCGFTASTEAEFYKHFNSVHARTNRHDDGKFHCQWQGNPEFRSRSGLVVISAKDPCNHALDRLTSLMRHCRDHQYQLWRQYDV